jgi:lipopolysaccharide export system permease protein
MITKLDWYILRKFFTTFFFCMIGFTIIAVAVDSSEKTDDFVKAGLSTSQIISEYYVGFVPYIWGLLYPLFVFIAVIFFTSRMALRSEIIAMLANGITYNRWLRPYVIGGLVFAVSLWVISAFWIPKANDIRSSFQTTYIDKNDPTKGANQGGCYNCYYMRLDSNSYVGIIGFDTATKSARNFFMQKVRNNQVYYNLRADQIQWNDSSKNWKLTNVVERRIDSSREVITKQPLVYLNMKVRPAELRKDDYLKDKLTTPELRSFIETEEARGREGLNTLKVEMYRRTAGAFSVFLLTMIGAVLAGRKTRGGGGLHMALGIVIAVTFILFDRFSTVFSIKGNFPPLLAAWTPNLLFSLIAVYLYVKAPK